MVHSISAKFESPQWLCLYNCITDSWCWLLSIHSIQYVQTCTYKWIKTGLYDLDLLLKYHSAEKVLLNEYYFSLVVNELPDFSLMSTNLGFISSIMSHINKVSKWWYLYSLELLTVPAMEGVMERLRVSDQSTFYISRSQLTSSVNI